MSRKAQNERPTDRPGDVAGKGIILTYGDRGPLGLRYPRLRPINPQFAHEPPEWLNPAADDEDDEPAATVIAPATANTATKSDD